MGYKDIRLKLDLWSGIPPSLLIGTLDELLLAGEIPIELRFILCVTPAAIGNPVTNPINSLEPPNVSLNLVTNYRVLEPW